MNDAEISQYNYEDDNVKNRQEPFFPNAMISCVCCILAVAGRNNAIFASRLRLFSFLFFG